MPSKEEAKQEVKKLIEFYNSNKDSFKESSEADIRIKLIDRLFEVLGWDVWGRKIGSEVTREETVKMKESKKKKADYAFRLHGIPKFVVEVKAIKNIDLSSDEFREQAVGYAYNLACSWAVLTNFVKTRIYFVDKEDGVVTFNISDISDLGSFDKNFEILWFLSNDAVKDDLLGKYLDDKGIKPQKGSVGKQLYEDLKDWRSILSDEIKSKHGNYEKYVIEETVQRIIDRLIFIRKVEDMEIEERKLEQLTRRFNEGKTYEQLKIIFKTYRQKYNSGLFGEKEEHECDRISISDKPIETMIRGMYIPKGRRIEYNFAVIDADVLGNIYEQYLAYILHETPKKAKLEGGRSHRKEQGIYYTPIYIVDYIVKNTVFEALKDKTIDEILSAKILDPACGSGSFLIRAFSEVCRIVEDKMEKGDRSKISPSLKDYSGRLTMKQKITILLSCIYGVDLDKKAVEIAQLNLLFKLLEGETAETISQIEGLRKILPTLSLNIKHGNSLINDRKIAGDDAFNWEDEFKEIMSNGGFDIVIGNPPYIRVDSLAEKDKIYWKKRFKSSQGKYDIYYLFIESVFRWLKNNGYCGFIVPNKFCAASSAEILRDTIINNSDDCRIISVSNLDVFKDASNYPVILLLTKGNGIKKIDIEYVLKEEEFLKKNFAGYHLKNELEFLPSEIFPININQNEFDLVVKILKKNEKLLKYLKISEGLRIPPKLEDENVNDIEILKQFQFNKYSPISKGTYISKENLEKAVSKTSERYVNSLKDKIVIAEDALSITAVIDDKKRLPQGGVYFGVPIQNTFYLKYLLGLLNSKLLSYVYKILFGGMHMGGGYLRYRTEFLEQLPVKILSEKEQQPLIKLVDKMLSLNKKLSEMKAKTDERAKLEEQIKKMDSEIDKLVYKLYGITEEEKKIIEESLK